MARSFLTYKSNPYIGTLYTVPIQLLSPLAQNPAAVQHAMNVPKALVVPAQINWAIYGNAGTANPNQIVSFVLGQSAQSQTISQIRSVYVDNSDSNYPISVIFPDTQFVVNVQPNSSAFYPVMSNSLTAYVAITGVQDGDIPQTNLLFSDTFPSPYDDVEVQGVSSQLLNSVDGYYSAAVGDLATEVHVSLAGGSAKPFDLANKTDGNFILTAATLNIYGVKNASGTDCNFTASLSNPPSASPVFFARFIVPTGNAVNICTTIFQRNGWYKRLDATRFDFIVFSLLNVDGVSVSGGCQLLLDYTYAHAR